MTDYNSQNPPSGMAPPPPPPPAGLFPAQPGSPQPPQAPKRGFGLVIGLVAGLVLLCALVSCGTIALVGISGGGDKAAAKQAETHLGAAMSAVASASLQVQDTSSGKAGSTVDTANKTLRTGRDEVAAARASAERIGNASARADYLAALDQATNAMNGIEDLIAYTGTVNGMAELMNEATTASSKGADQLNAAVSAGNSAKYSTMRTKAAAAYSSYAKAAALYSAADKLDKSAGLIQKVAYAKKRQAQALLIRSTADAAMKHGTSAYNKNVNRMNSLSRQAAAVHDPALFSDPNWVEKRLAVLRKQATDAADKADALRAKALKELGL